jgi:hypothetical protein
MLRSRQYRAKRGNLSTGRPSSTLDKNRTSLVMPDGEVWAHFRPYAPGTAVGGGRAK